MLLCNAPPERAPEIARTVVDEGLAACVNLLAAQSVYRWQGSVVEEAETTLVLKVPADGVARLRARLLELHPYEVPEIVTLAVDVEQSHAPYVEWVRRGGG